ncbi:hypothetical protein HELRODRAFT_177906 [Helobdella robusta]|uniref:WSC domain-containing protein n=1 Tax=Helobdella robusta TaxID=6412 RepID=T1FCG3_HELRO|nr:hypothetical protein HELRODRAFT_177906 [Helobdella robusta]ESN97483.1 hypothetical protein HELRODRAFT_177906 [Helobdella robusta]
MTASSMKNSLTFCRKYTKSLACPGMPMIMPCVESSRVIATSVMYFKFEKIPSSAKYSIAEIEVFGDETLTHVYTYIGCFAVFKGQKIIGDYSFSSCVSECQKRAKANIVFAFKKRTLCYYGAEPEEKVPQRYCHLACDGSVEDSQKICGGNRFYSVYSGIVTEKTLMGCFRQMKYERGAKHHKIEINPLTPYGSCLLMCKKMQPQHFAIKNGKQCLCGNLFLPNELLPLSKCDVVCVDNPKKSCGGRDSYSVYSIFNVYNFSEPPRVNRFCMNEEPFNNETCVPGKCQNGWSGPLCDETDLLTECQHPERRIIYRNGSFGEIVDNMTFSSSDDDSNSTADGNKNDQSINMVTVGITLSVISFLLLLFGVLFAYFKRQSKKIEQALALKTNRRIGYF